MATFRSLAASALACCLLSYTSSRVADAYMVKVDAATTITASWDGWGTSLSWWANHFGKRADIADALFTLKTNVSLNAAARSLPGLGFNIVRYNIGGSSKNIIDNAGVPVVMKHSDGVLPFRFMESFWIDWMNPDPESGSWNWLIDENQRDMLALAVKRGADQLEAFSNSPPWWMNKNLASAGGDKGDVDNLTPHNQEQFAMYLAKVLKRAKTNWNITFNYIEPFNEPSQLWWEFPLKQEGCHFTLASQKAIIPLLRKQLDALDLQDVAISVSDENSPEVALRTLQFMEKTPGLVDKFTKVNTHGYDGLEVYRGGKRGELKDLVRKLSKTLWDSEMGDSDASGLIMAESICLDINEMGVMGIVYWQVHDSGGAGFVQTNAWVDWMGKANPKYYVMAHYSRHIRPGMKILASDDIKTVVGYDADKKLLVLVTVNVGDVLLIKYDLGSFGAVAGSVRAWTTEISGTGALYSKRTIPVREKMFSINFPAKSIMTFEIAKVTLAA